MTATPPNTPDSPLTDPTPKPGRKARKPRIQVVIDTREQKPWHFDPLIIEETIATLPVGDYSLRRLESRLFIERKSLDDFVGSITYGRDRFFREFERAVGLQMVGCVIVEGSVREVLDHYYTSHAHPSSVMGSAVAIWMDYGYPVYFASDRSGARELAQKILIRWAHKLCEAPDSFYDIPPETAQ